MAVDSLSNDFGALMEMTWALARKCLDQGEIENYRSLMDIMEKLNALTASHSKTDYRASVEESISPKPELIPIFRNYKNQRYEAQFDASRVEGGRGACVLYDGEWLTTSASATKIAARNTNGWIFWKYLNSLGHVSLIDELR